jgi:hypothetical protein
MQTATAVQPASACDNSPHKAPSGDAAGLQAAGVANGADRGSRGRGATG